MISQAVIRKYKLDSESLKPLFDKEALDKIDSKKIGNKADPATTAAHRRKQLVELLAARQKTGRTQKLKEWRTPAAIDLAYNAPFYQETPTIIRHILSTCGNATDAMAATKAWKVCESELFCTVKDSNGVESQQLNASKFNEVILPFVRAYTNMRLSKLFNDRNGIPLFKYEPQKNTEINRVRCEILTDIVQAMSTQFGYSATMRQMILNTLLYSVCIVFPMEPWYEEMYEDTDGKEKVEKRGIRYVAPHITQTAYDLQHPLSTMNSNTGCSWALFWTIGKYGDLADDTRYWNTKSVTYGYDWTAPDHAWSSYLQTAFPCTQKFPKLTETTTETDREKAAVYYSDGDYDKPVMVTHQFCKLKPKDWGLGDYKYYVWFRFTMASDDTIIWADTYSYNPLIVSLYDGDQNRAQNASLAQEIVPFQDLATNLLNQTLLTIKRNLWNVSLYDKNQISESLMGDLKVHSTWQYQGVPLVPVDTNKNKFAQYGSGNGRLGDAVSTITLPYADTSAQMQQFSVVINMLERMIGVSAQEIGSAASHQQSKAEIQVITASTSNRVTYTGSFIDEARDAWKRQLVDASLAHMSEEDVKSQVSSNIPDLETHLRELGFQMDGETKGKRKVQVKGKMSEKLRLESFASSKDSPDRGNDAQAATAMFTALGQAASNPRIGPAIKVKSFIDQLEIGAKKMGADDDFNLEIDENALQIQGVKEALPQIAAELEKDIQTKFIDPMMGKVAKDNQAQDQQINQLVQIVEKLVASAKQAPPTPSPTPLVPPLTTDANNINPDTGAAVAQAPQLA